MKLMKFIWRAILVPLLTGSLAIIAVMWVAFGVSGMWIAVPFSGLPWQMKVLGVLMYWVPAAAVLALYLVKEWDKL